MQVIELINELDKLPEDATIILAFGEGEREVDFEQIEVTYADERNELVLKGT